jgi:hypothetical protein
MQQCPLCGSELVCTDSALWHWCISPECGACFRDIHLDGAARRLAGPSRGERFPPGPAAPDDGTAGNEPAPKDRHR